MWVRLIPTYPLGKGCSALVTCSTNAQRCICRRYTRPTSLTTLSTRPRRFSAALPRTAFLMPPWFLQSTSSILLTDRSGVQTDLLYPFVRYTTRVQAHVALSLLDRLVIARVPDTHVKMTTLYPSWW